LQACNPDGKAGQLSGLGGNLTGEELNQMDLYSFKA
jgi:hypothetical protein